MKNFRLDRRAALRGAGVSLGLPLLEAMIPGNKTAFAQEVQSPPRFVGYYFPEGMIMEHFRMPLGDLGSMSMSDTLSPFEDLKEDILYIIGLSAVPAGPGGEHSRGTRSFLRASHQGPSVDQIAHQAHSRFGDATRFGSVAIGGQSACSATDGPAAAIDLCHISWKNTGIPTPKESDPLNLFNRLFQSRDSGYKDLSINSSILGAVSGDLHRLHNKLGVEDRLRVGSFLAEVESVEHLIQQQGCVDSALQPEATEYENYENRTKLLIDLLVLAFKCDLARYMSFMVFNGFTCFGYLRVLLGLPNLDCGTVHNPGGRSFEGEFHQVNRWEMRMYHYLVKSLKDTKDFTGMSLLDSCFCFASSDVSDSSRHNYNDMPVLCAGSCNGYFKTGESVRSDKNFGSVWVSVLDALGFPQEVVGQSMGPANELRR
jgi:Protein of unknown function (DUF1552)